MKRQLLLLLAALCAAHGSITLSPTRATSFRADLMFDLERTEASVEAQVLNPFVLQHITVTGSDGPPFACVFTSTDSGDATSFIVSAVTQRDAGDGSYLLACPLYSGEVDSWDLTISDANNLIGSRTATANDDALDVFLSPSLNPLTGPPAAAVPAVFNSSAEAYVYSVYGRVITTCEWNGVVGTVTTADTAPLGPTTSDEADGAVCRLPAPQASGASPLQTTQEGSAVASENDVYFVDMPDSVSVTLVGSADSSRTQYLLLNGRASQQLFPQYSEALIGAPVEFELSERPSSWSSDALAGQLAMCRWHMTDGSTDFFVYVGGIATQSGALRFACWLPRGCAVPGGRTAADSERAGCSAPVAADGSSPLLPARLSLSLNGQTWMTTALTALLFRVQAVEAEAYIDARFELYLRPTRLLPLEEAVALQLQLLTGAQKAAVNCSTQCDTLHSQSCDASRQWASRYAAFLCAFPALTPVAAGTAMQLRARTQDMSEYVDAGTLTAVSRPTLTAAERSVVESTAAVVTLLSTGDDAAWVGTGVASGVCWWYYGGLRQSTSLRESIAASDTAARIVCDNPFVSAWPVDGSQLVHARVGFSQLANDYVQPQHSNLVNVTFFQRPSPLLTSPERVPHLQGSGNVTVYLHVSDQLAAAFNWTCAAEGVAQAVWDADASALRCTADTGPLDAAAPLSRLNVQWTIEGVATLTPSNEGSVYSYSVPQVATTMPRVVTSGSGTVAIALSAQAHALLGASVDDGLCSFMRGNETTFKSGTKSAAPPFSLICDVPAVSVPGGYALAYSIDRGAIWHDAEAIYIDEASVVTAVKPASSPTTGSGLVISGSFPVVALHPRVEYVADGQPTVNASCLISKPNTVLCAAVPLPRGKYRLDFVVNDNDRTTAQLAYTVWQPPAAADLSVSSRTAPVAGGTVLTISGVNDSSIPTAACFFGSVFAQASIEVADAADKDAILPVTLRCLTPSEALQPNEHVPGEPIKLWLKLESAFFSLGDFHYVCPAGQARADDDSGSCIVCSPGFFSDNQSCVPCPAGTSNPAEGAQALASCIPCPLGFANAEQGQAECTGCASGTYSAVRGALNCTACPEASSSAARSTALSNCQCQPGYYGLDTTAAASTIERLGNITASCVACAADGLSCPRAGMLQPEALPGFFFDQLQLQAAAGGNGSVVSVVGGVLRCSPSPKLDERGAIVHAGACPGGLQPACSPGYGSSGCSSCLRGAAVAAGSNATTKTATKYYRFQGDCLPCSTTAATPVLVGMGFLLLLLLPLAVRVSRSCSSAGSGLGTMFTSTVNALQMAALFGSFSLRWPDGLQRFLDALSALNLNFELLQPECALEVSYQSKWLSQMLLPLLVLGLLAVYRLLAVTLLRSRYQGAALASLDGNLTQLVLLLATVGYISISGVALEPFDCTRNLDGVTRLDAEPTIECSLSDAQWAVLAPLAVVATLLYVVGVPGAIAYVLYRHRTLESRSTLSFLHGLGTLTFRYEAEWFWWELLVLARKLALVVVADFWSERAVLQLLMSMLVILLALLAHVFARPFAAVSHDRLEFMLMGATFFTLFSGLLYMSQQLTAGEAEMLMVATLLMYAGSFVALLVFVKQELQFLSRMQRHRDVVRKLGTLTHGLLPNEHRYLLSMWLLHAQPEHEQLLGEVCSAIHDYAASLSAAESDALSTKLSMVTASRRPAMLGYALSCDVRSRAQLARMLQLLAHIVASRKALRKSIRIVSSVDDDGREVLLSVPKHAVPLSTAAAAGGRDEEDRRVEEGREGSSSSEEASEGDGSAERIAILPVAMAAPSAALFSSSSSSRSASVAAGPPVAAAPEAAEEDAGKESEAAEGKALESEDDYDYTDDESDYYGADASFIEQKAMEMLEASYRGEAARVRADIEAQALAAMAEEVLEEEQAEREEEARSRAASNASAATAAAMDSIHDGSGEDSGATELRLPGTVS